jgi:hypothetical protein
LIYHSDDDQVLNQLTGNKRWRNDSNQATEHDGAILYDYPVNANQSQSTVYNPSDAFTNHKSESELLILKQHRIYISSQPISSTSHTLSEATAQINQSQPTYHRSITNHQVSTVVRDVYQDHDSELLRDLLANSHSSQISQLRLQNSGNNQYSSYLPNQSISLSDSSHKFNNTINRPSHNALLSQFNSSHLSNPGDNYDNSIRVLGNISFANSSENLPILPNLTVMKKSLSWQRHFAALVEYGKEHGHCNIPVRATYDCDLPVLDEEGKRLRYHGNLGKWLHDQRQCQKGNKNDKLRPEREALLQALVDQGNPFFFNA